MKNSEVGFLGSVSHGDLDGFSVEHRARRVGAVRAPVKPPPPMRRIVRELVLIAAILGAIVLAGPFADVPNPEHPEANALADRLTSAYRAIWRGEASVEATASAEDLAVFEFPAGERSISVLTHTQPTAAGTCYGLRFGGGETTIAIKFTSSSGCVPFHEQSTIQAAGPWEDVLPTERLTTVWFVPVLIVLASCIVVIITDIGLKLIFR
jgi:hypothetical protein